MTQHEGDAEEPSAQESPTAHHDRTGDSLVLGLTELATAGYLVVVRRRSEMDAWVQRVLGEDEGGGPTLLAFMASLAAVEADHVRRGER